MEQGPFVQLMIVRWSPSQVVELSEQLRESDKLVVQL